MSMGAGTQKLPAGRVRAGSTRGGYQVGGGSLRAQAEQSSTQCALTLLWMTLPFGVDRTGLIIA